MYWVAGCSFAHLNSVAHHIPHTHTHTHTSTHTCMLAHQHTCSFSCIHSSVCILLSHSCGHLILACDDIHQLLCVWGWVPLFVHASLSTSWSIPWQQQNMHVISVTLPSSTFSLSPIVQSNTHTLLPLSSSCVCVCVCVCASTTVGDL